MLTDTLAPARMNVSRGIWDGPKSPAERSTVGQEGSVMSTIRTRKNRQTGTMITVGRSDELQVNDGIGWALVCEDHGVIMSCDTRKQAERQATAPLGWCQFCNGTLVNEPCECGKCAACITQEEHDGEPEDDDSQCVCGVFASEHSMMGCGNFQSPASWEREKAFIASLDEWEYERIYGEV